jgi:hypothetical protein
MGVFAAADIYRHMNTAHGGIYERAAAPVQNVDLREQQEVLRQAEERRRAQDQAERVRQRHPPGILDWQEQVAAAARRQREEAQRRQHEERVREQQRRVEEERRRREGSGRGCTVM